MNHKEWSSKSGAGDALQRAGGEAMGGLSGFETVLRRG